MTDETRRPTSIQYGVCRHCDQRIVLRPSVTSGNPLKWFHINGGTCCPPFPRTYAEPKADELGRLSERDLRKIQQGDGT